LIQSGAGVSIEASGGLGPAFVNELSELLNEFRFVVLKNGPKSLEDAVELMRQFGPINEAETRKQGAVMVEDKLEDEAEVFRSRFALPLHKDGVLTGFDVVTVGIYCAAFTEVEGGRTYVSDAMRALAEIPPEQVESLRSNGLEGMAVDSTGYYREEYEGVWHPFPAFKAKAGCEPTLNIGLPPEEGEPASWQVRVAGVEKEESDAILGSLRRWLLADEYTYFHDWKEGDLVLMDNYQVLHGREAWSGRARQLANIQVLSAPV